MRWSSLVALFVVSLSACASSTPAADASKPEPTPAPAEESEDHVGPSHGEALEGTTVDPRKTMSESCEAACTEVGRSCIRVVMLTDPFAAADERPDRSEIPDLACGDRLPTEEELPKTVGLTCVCH